MIPASMFSLLFVIYPHLLFILNIFLYVVTSYSSAFAFECSVLKFPSFCFDP